MSDEPTPGVLGGLPRTRPHRRSAKRPSPAPPPIADEPAVQAAARAVKAPRGTAPRKAAAEPKPRAKPARPKPRAARKPLAAAPPPARQSPLGMAAQAAAELAEIGLMVGARAIRGALDRLPRP